MKTIHVYFVVLSVLLLVITSCGSKTKQNNIESSIDASNAIENTSVHISEIHFDNNWNKLDNQSAQLSKSEYESLKLADLSFMENFGDLQYEKGETLVDEENRKLLTIKTISSGEISEYLLGYINNSITDSLLVAYEDNVEYYSTTSSVIKDDTITVTTINFDYNGIDEVADTITNKYRITPHLLFDEIIEE